MKLKELIILLIASSVNLVIFAALVLALSGCADSPAQQEETPAVQTETQAETETAATDATEDSATVTVTTTTAPAETVTITVTRTVTQDQTSDATADTPAPQPNPAPAKFHIKYAAIQPSGIKFFDGFNWTLTAYEKRAAPSVYMVRDEIHQLNEFGEPASLIYTPVSGELVKKTSTGYLLCDSLTPTESAALGAQARVYSKIYEYQAGSWSELGHWFLNQWECSGFQESESGELSVSDTTGKYHALKSTKQIHLSVDSGLLIYDFNTTAKSAKFQTSSAATTERWLRNYINTDRQWQKIEGKYYSSLGYVYSPTISLQEFGNAMEGFRAYPYAINMTYGERPTIISAGTDAQKRVIYWVECATGYLIEYRLATNQIAVSRMLYNGAGTTAEGQSIAKTLNPILSQGKLYFSYSGQIMQLDLGTGGVSVVLAEPGWLLLF